MKLIEEIENSIREEAEKLSLRYHAYHNAVQLEYERTARRIKSPPPKQLKQPPYWSSDPKFNPFYVLKRSSAIARSIGKKIQEQQYAPNPPQLRQIRKPQGGVRTISVYQIPDAAVSRLFYGRMLRKNRHRFSDSSYAYRDDKNAHFAIQDISIDLAELSRVFVAEYDFSKFFDSIQHEYLFEQFSKNGFSISPREEHVVRAFLAPLNGKGVPQGTSISLFLANLVCWRLDRQLDRAGLRFARYADDTVIWSSEYGKISKAVDLIAEFSTSAQIPINFQKSKGIRILAPPGMPAELAERTDSIEFLGYSISVDRVGIKASSVRKIKRQLNFILYQHLIQPLRGPALKAVEIPSSGVDKDLIAAISSIRRFMYGNLTDEYIRRFLAGSTGHIFYKGAMSFYPLLSDKGQMQELDGWLVSQVWKAVQLRGRLLQKWGHPRWTNFPFNCNRSSFADDLRAAKVNGRRAYAIPSFVVVYLALQKIVSQQGVLELLGQEYL